MSTTWSVSSGPGPAPSATNQFSFPLLPADDIIVCLKNLNIPFSIEQLKAPTPDAVRTLFEALVVSLMNISKEELSQPCFPATDVLQFPELHEDSIPVLAVHRNLAILFDAAGFREFRLADFMNPQYPRLRKALSAVINFAKFRAGRLDAFADISAGSEKLAVRRAAGIEKTAALDRALNKMRDARLKSKPEIDALDQANKDYRSEILLLRQAEDRLRADIHAQKKTFTQVANKNKVLKETGQLEAQEIEYCQAQIVKSPERVKRDLADHSEQLQADQRAIAGIEARTKQIRARFQALDTCNVDVKAVTKLMGECKVEQTKLQQLQTEIGNKKQVLIDLQSESKTANDTYDHLQKQLRSTEERHHRLESQGDQRNVEAQTQLVDREREKKQVLAERQANEQTIKENTDRAAELKARMEAQRTVHEKHISECLQLQQYLYKAVEDHRIRVMEALENV